MQSIFLSLRSTMSILCRPAEQMVYSPCHGLYNFLCTDGAVAITAIAALIREKPGCLKKILVLLTDNLVYTGFAFLMAGILMEPWAREAWEISGHGSRWPLSQLQFISFTYIAELWIQTGAMDCPYCFIMPDNNVVRSRIPPGCQG